MSGGHLSLVEQEPLKCFQKCGIQIRILFLSLMNLLNLLLIYSPCAVDLHTDAMSQKSGKPEDTWREGEARQTFLAMGRSGITGFCCRHHIISQWHPRLSQLCQPSCMICRIRSCWILTIRCHHRCNCHHPSRSFCSRVGR